MTQIFKLTPTETLLTTALFLLVYMSLWGLGAVIKKRADLADIAWGLGFFLVSWTSFLLSSFSYPSFLLNLMVTFWAFRLSLHIARRNRNRKEDFRYEALKKNWKNYFRLRIFCQVFLLQGMILYVVALPILWINTHPETISSDDLILIFPFWLLGFLVETIADEQLATFQKNPSNKGKLLTSGLWKFVRHPNYLAELIQWWAIWALSANFLLLASPLLISFLIIKVSGVAPLEKKMESHPDFANYAAKTPSLIPFSIVNGAVYSIGWFLLLDFGAKSSPFMTIGVFFLTYVTQLLLFYKYERKSLEISPILSIYALLLGLFQEIIFINTHLLQYPNESFFPPLWVLYLYPLFALTFNCSLSFINKNLPFSFFLGGFGALLSYIYAESIGAVQIPSQLSYPLIFLSWGLYLTLVVLVNRKLNRLREKYTDPVRLQNALTVFFDQKCPVCSMEMRKLEKRKQTGTIIYDCIESEEEFKKKSSQISYKTAMKKIQAIDSNGEIFSGTDALSEIYARTNFLWIAIFLQTYGFRQVFILIYAIWAKVRTCF